MLFAPDLRVNYGFASGWEASLEGDVSHGLTAGIPGTSVIAGEALLKGVLREGGLQEKPGPSIATEFGVLLPGINDQHGTGAILTGIVSQRWDWGTTHFNAQIDSPASSMWITFSTRLSRVRMTGQCDRSPKPFMRAMSACFEPAPPSSGRSGRSKTISRLTLVCAARAPMAKPPARSARASRSLSASLRRGQTFCQA